MLQSDLHKLPESMTPEKLEKIKSQIKREYEEGLTFHNTWIAPKRDNAKYLLGEKSSKKIHVRSIWSILQTLLSIFYIDERKVVFSSTGPEGKYVAETYNKLAQFDYKKMRKHLYDFILVFYGVIYGVGVNRIKGWDKKNNRPILEYIPTLSCILDPYEFSGELRRYFGCFKETLLTELQRDDKYIDRFSIKADNEADDRVTLYNHYTKYEDKIYVTTWANEVGLLIKIEEFDLDSAIGEDFGVTVFQPYPIPGRVGADLIDLGAEYQKFLSQIINLMLIQAKKDVLGEDRIIDITKIDFKDLQKQQIGGNNIPVEPEPGDNLSNMVYTIPKEGTNYKADAGIQQLRYLLQESTAVPDIVQGVQPGKVVTKGEMQQLQMNANGKFGTISRFLLLSDEGFWLAYQRYYRYCFVGKKNISIKHKYATDFLVITRNDITSRDFIEFQVYVESKAEKKARNSEKFAQMTVLLPMSMPYMSQSEQIIAMRDYWELAGMEQDEILARFPLSVDELRAREQLELLNENKDISPPDPNEDHRVYLTIYQQGLPTRANMKAQAIRRMMLQRQPSLQGGASDNMQNMQNIAQAQAGNNLIQQQNGANNISSNMDVNV